MGGFISIHLLAFHPERFTSAVVGGIGGLNPTNVEVLTNQVIANALLAEDPSTITDPVGKAFRDFAGLDPINDLKALAAAALTREEKEVTPADLATLNIPVLIAAGGADPLVSEPEKLQAAIPGSRLLVVPGLDHIMFVPNQQFKDAVVSFLKD
jgi:pimeloyl-ACP methyl ester carboxylesterase